MPAGIARASLQRGRQAHLRGRDFVIADEILCASATLHRGACAATPARRHAAGSGSLTLVSSAFESASRALEK